MQYVSDTLDKFSLQNLGRTMGSLGEKTINTLQSFSLQSLGLATEPKTPLEQFQTIWDEIYTAYKNDGTNTQSL